MFWTPIHAFKPDWFIIKKLINFLTGTPRKIFRTHTGHYSVALKVTSETQQPLFVALSVTTPSPHPSQGCPRGCGGSYFGNSGNRDIDDLSPTSRYQTARLYGLPGRYRASQRFPGHREVAQSLQWSNLRIWGFSRFGAIYWFDISSR